MSAKLQIEKEIWEAYLFLRNNNNTIPSDTLEFIRDAALEKLKQSGYEKFSSSSEEELFHQIQQDEREEIK